MRCGLSMSGVAAALAVALVCGTPKQATADAPQVPASVIQFAMTVPMSGYIQYEEVDSQPLEYSFRQISAISGTIVALPSDVDTVNNAQSAIAGSAAVAQVYFEDLAGEFRGINMIIQQWFSAVGAANVRETADGPKGFHLFRASDGRPVFTVSTRKNLPSLLSGARGPVAARVRARLPLRARVWTSKGSATLTITSIKGDRATFSAHTVR